ncbi:hypothetical protein D9758_011648 [Tetrapyrgos nigripes]|uniref:Uncharacterized protein n=1 Tax=Tetrapyrgos nigripes TaxID=182062 RepID=A0A8H5CUZ4_9AGAR|nr:hypothetical protein D9758_011648 [Tetrapyrgos nigripes]
MSVPTVTSINSGDFLGKWTAELESDFSKDDQPAVFLPGHPKEWGQETARINLPIPADSARLTHIALNDDGHYLAVSADSDVRIYDTSSLEVVRTLPGIHPRSVSSIRFQPGQNLDGKLLVSGTSSRGDRHGFDQVNVVRCWDLGEPAEMAITPDTLAEAAQAATSAAVGVLAAGRNPFSNDDVSKIQNQILDTLSWTQVKLGLQSGHACEGRLTKGRVFSSDGSLFLYANQHNAVVISDSQTLQERYTLVGHTGLVTWAETTPDDSIVGTSSWDRTVRLWNTSTGEQLRVLTGVAAQIWIGAFSPDGSVLCAGIGDGQIRVWSVGNGELLHTLGGFDRWVRSIAFSPDGKHVAAGSRRGTLRIFEVSTWESAQLWRVEQGPGASFLEVNAFYTSRGLLVFRCGGRVFTYDLETNQKGYYKHAAGITQSSASGQTVATSDGQTLINVDFDRNVRLWRLA